MPIPQKGNAMSYNDEILPGAFIEIQYGRNKGQTGIVIGAHISELSGYPLLAVYLENRTLDLIVAPETVEVLASHSDVLENAPIMLAPEEIQALKEISRLQNLKANR